MAAYDARENSREHAQNARGSAMNPLLAVVKRTVSRALSTSSSASSVDTNPAAPQLLALPSTPPLKRANAQAVDALLANAPPACPALRLAATHLLRFHSEEDARAIVERLLETAQSRPWYFLARTPAALDGLVVLCHRALATSALPLVELFAPAGGFDAVLRRWLESLFNLEDDFAMAEKNALLILGTFFAQGHVGLVNIACNLAPLWAAQGAFELSAPLSKSDTFAALSARSALAGTSVSLLKLASGDVISKVTSFKPALLEMGETAWVGFDVDHTLVEYDNAQMDAVTLAAALGVLGEDDVDRLCSAALKLVKAAAAYPMFKMCSLDVARGDLLKLDANCVVCERKHGTRSAPVPTDGRPRDVDALVVVHTHFERVMVPCFARLVDLVDASHADEAARTELYKAGFNRLLTSLAHAQSPLCEHGLSDAVARRHVGVRRQPRVVLQWLRALRERGLKLFLLTDSKQVHVDKVMALALGDDWASLFDLVVSDAKKATFFTRPTPARSVRSLANAGKTKLVESGGIVSLAADIGSGSSVVYFGDHVQKDVVNPVAQAGWRAVAVVSEMDDDGLLPCFSTPDGSPSLLAALITRHAVLCVPSIEAVAAAGLFVTPDWTPALIDWS